LTERGIFKFSKIPKLKSPSLVVGWSKDAGKLGAEVIDFLNKKLGSQEFCQIEPTGFFSLGGVKVEDDMAQFPESKFYCCERGDLVIFKSNQPQYEWYKFLNSVLDVAEYHCKIKELYTVSGTVCSIAHTSPRRILTVFNQPELKNILQGYGLVDMEYEGEPALNSYLLWMAKRRNIPGVSLWAEIPFYLAAEEDPKAWRRILEFFDRKFTLNIDLEEISEEIKKQNKKMMSIRRKKPVINKYISQLEKGFMLNEKEQEKLAKEVYGLLKKRK